MIPPCSPILSGQLVLRYGTGTNVAEGLPHLRRSPSNKIPAPTTGTLFLRSHLRPLQGKLSRHSCSVCPLTQAVTQLHGDRPSGLRVMTWLLLSEGDQRASEKQAPLAHPAFCSPSFTYPFQLHLVRYFPCPSSQLIWKPGQSPSICPPMLSMN